MSWIQYAIAALVFNALGFLAVYALQRFQAALPLNPAELGAVSPGSSFNTAVSFATNTNWQGYGGESTMSYLTQMLAIAGSLAAKKIVPASPGTLPTHTPLFVVLLLSTVLIVGALTFVPALALGPVVEHFQMLGM